MTTLFVDDTSEIVKEKDNNILKARIQDEADRAIEWMDCNKMIISEKKTKLMITFTTAMRRLKQLQDIKIVIKRMTINQTRSERILGVVMNDELNWKYHPYGERDKTHEYREPALLKELSKRVGFFTHIARYASGTMLRSMATGLFYSKLRYSLPIFANIWTKEKYNEKNTKMGSTTKEDIRKLQVLQNKVERVTK